MNDAAAFRATYSDWRLIRSRKIVQIVFELPLEQAYQAYEALGGMPNPAAEVWCGIARLVQPTGKGVIDQDATTLLAQKPASDPPGRAPDKKLSQLAGMLSKTPLFHRWLESIGFMNANEKLAADYIRSHCRVESRSRIIPNTPAADAFLKLYDMFIRWRDADQYVEAP